MGAVFVLPCVHVEPTLSTLISPENQMQLPSVSTGRGEFAGDFLGTREESVSPHVLQPNFMTPSKSLSSLPVPPRQCPLFLILFLTTRLPPKPVLSRANAYSVSASCLPPSLVVMQRTTITSSKAQKPIQGQTQALSRMSLRVPLQITHGRVFISLKKRNW